MNRFLLVTALLAAFSAFPSRAQAPAAGAGLQPVDRIVAVVDEDVILQSELDRALRNVMSQYAGRQDQLPPDDILRKQVLERLVLVRLQVARAQAAGITVSDGEIDQAVNGVASQNSLTLDQLRQQLARDGITYADFRSTLRDEMVSQRLRQSYAQGRINVSEAEVDAAMATQSGGMQYRLSHILVALPEGATPEQIATGQQKIDGVKGLLDKGEMDFAAAAVRYSDSPNALEGGDLGWRRADEIPTAFASTLSTLQPGQVVGPVRGPSGFQLIKLVETRKADPAAGGQVTQYQARHIFIGSADPANDAAAKAKIDTVAARLAGGADFAALAKESSTDANTKDKGGDLGWFAQDLYGAEFGQQVAALTDNQVSAPFRTQEGWHIVQRMGSRQAAATADESRRAQVRESIGQRKLEDEWGRFLRELRGEAYVDIRGADTAQTAPATPAAPAPANGG